jgi:hypothetical protein
MSSDASFNAIYSFSPYAATYFSYALAIYLVDDFLLSFLLGLIALVGSILYIIHFAVYTRAYVKKSLLSVKSTKSMFKGGERAQTRTFASEASFAAEAATKVNAESSAIAKTLFICAECLKILGIRLVSAELIFKVARGSMAVVPSWRARVLNQMFPDDPTKL